MAKEPSPPAPPLRLEGPGPFPSRRVRCGLGADRGLLIHSVGFQAPGTGPRWVRVGGGDAGRAPALKNSRSWTRGNTDRT